MIKLPKIPYRIFKPEVVRIRLSSPMMVRARCKYCMGSPTIYYFIRNPTLFVNPKDAIARIQKYRGVLTLIHREHPTYSPKYVDSASSFAHPIIWTKYRPRLHRTIGSSATFDIVEYISCDCMRSKWAFADKAAEQRAEITCRKSSKRFPNRFEF